jgi:hypothetical protein
MVVSGKYTRRLLISTESAVEKTANRVKNTEAGF